MFVNHRQDNWSDWLAVAQFCHNDRVHSSTGYTPFFMNNGRHPNKGVNPLYTVKGSGCRSIGQGNPGRIRKGDGGTSLNRRNDEKAL